MNIINGKEDLKGVKMCLNCPFYSVVTDDKGNRTEFCTNEDNKALARAKIQESCPEGFKITSLEVSNLSLKNPTKKCSHWVLDEQRMLDYIKSLFADSVETTKPDGTANDASSTEK